MVEQNYNTFFAAANTSKGFQNYFPQIFNPQSLDKIFILKGGPGTGKSSFMRIISRMAREKGYDTEEFLCSSDPKSLDGLIIPKLKLAILDGTSPHTADPIYPGVVESIINTGAFWDTEKLCRNKSEIIYYIQNKKRYFRRAYHFLNAWGEIEHETTKIVEKSLQEEKMNQCIERILKKYHADPTDASEEIRIQSSINASGYKRLHSFEKAADEIYIVEDEYGTGIRFMETLREKAKRKGMKAVISPSCLFPETADSLYFPEQKLCFVLGIRDYEAELTEKNYHYVNMKRFLSKEYIQENKQKLKFAKRCSEMLLNGAVEAFCDAAAAHNHLEKIYIEAMNFKSWEESITSFANEHLI